MSRDIFDKQVGRLLRNAEMPVPPGAWQAISSSLNTSQAPQSFGFGAALVAGVLLLGSLGVYSTLKEEASYSYVAQLDEAMVTTVASNVTQVSSMPAAENASTIVAQDQSAPVAAIDQPSVLGERAATLAASINEASENMADEEHVADVDDKRETLVSEEDRVLNNAVSLPVTEHLESMSQPQSLKTPPASTQNAEVDTPKLRASIQAENLTGYAPFKIDFKALGNFDEVEWDFGPLGKSSKTRTSLTFDKPGTYTVMLYAFGAANEMISDMVTIEVHEGSNLVVPDSFTPNGDGINDTFKAEGVNIETFELTVIDERGKTVFQTRNINEPWVYQGYTNSAMQMYFAVIKARGIDGKDYRIKQRINIIF